ncbi:DciA family protein [Streptomyces sp. NPDC057381]|uniref:DciA family protein n=1 Tax=Streptomyces sp. NPDC057381 TaxID=3346111 RepID=UPI00363FC395
MTSADSRRAPEDTLARIALAHAREDARRRSWASRTAGARSAYSRPGRGPAVPVGDVVLRLFSQAGLSSLKWATLLVRWSTVADVIAPHVSPASFDASSLTLTLHCDSKAWLTQCRLLEEPLLKRLNEELEDLDFRVHRLRFVKSTPSAPRIPPPGSRPEPCRPLAFAPPPSDPMVEAAWKLQGQRLPREPQAPTRTA